MRNITLILVLFISTAPIVAQTKLIIPSEIEMPLQISGIEKNNVIKSYCVDFNGDHKLDFIIKIKTGFDQEPFTQEYWYTSDSRFFRKVDLFNMDFDLKYFVNLDDDSIPEILRASGYSDGIDYYFTKLDTITKSEKELFYFNPVIKKELEDKINYCWGYPWKLKSIFLKSEKNGPKRILCSFNHEISRAGEVMFPDNQTILPVIVFDGDNGDYLEKEEIKSTEWHSIREICERIKK